MFSCSVKKNACQPPEQLSTEPRINYLSAVLNGFICNATGSHKSETRVIIGTILYI